MSAVILPHVSLLPFGWIGVWLFFVISGFAITTSLIVDQAHSAPRLTLIGHFYLKRALRILPLYVTYLAMLAGYAGWLHLTGFWPALPYLFTFTYNIAIAFGSPVILAPGIVQLWSISGEEQFYLLFPFLFVFLGRRAFVLVLVTMLLVCPVARWWLGAIEGSPPMDVTAAARGVFFTPAHLDSFAAGALIALLTHGRIVSRRLGYAALAAGAGALALDVVSYAALQSDLDGSFGADSFRGIPSGRFAGGYREVFAFTAIWIAAAWLVLAVLARVPAVAAICRPRLFHAIRRVCYSGYVYHGLATELMVIRWPSSKGQLIAHRQFFSLCYASALQLDVGPFPIVEMPLLRPKPHRTAPPVSG